MTPLAQRIVRELTLPKSKRRMLDRCGLLSKMEDIHCFEVSEVVDAAFALVLGDAHRSTSERIQTVEKETGFLPAPNTWIEWLEGPAALEAGNDPTARTGILMMEQPHHDDILCMVAYGDSKLLKSMTQPFRFTFEHTDLRVKTVLPKVIEEYYRGWRTTIAGVLAMINTPRIIGRRQHMPHRGLERELAKSRGMVGRFPLHAWTEIKLEVGVPRVDSEEHEAHFTGRKALHFCRAHLRIKQGRIELVSAHWRGDPALGIKQSRYKVTT
jgi:hypothetical protein